MEIHNLYLEPKVQSLGHPEDIVAYSKYIERRFTGDKTGVRGN